MIKLIILERTIVKPYRRGKQSAVGRELKPMWKLENHTQKVSSHPAAMRQVTHMYTDIYTQSHMITRTQIHTPHNTSTCTMHIAHMHTHTHILTHMCAQATSTSFADWVTGETGV